MNVTPASSEAWMAAMLWLRSSGRPSMDIGMPPRPIAETVRDPICRVFTSAHYPVARDRTPDRGRRDAVRSLDVTWEDAQRCDCRSRRT